MLEGHPPYGKLKLDLTQLPAKGMKLDCKMPEALHILAVDVDDSSPRRARNSLF